MEDGRHSRLWQNNPAESAGKIGWWWTTATATQRHYEATGEWEDAAKAGVRAAGRWAIFMPCAIGYAILVPCLLWGTALLGLAEINGPTAAIYGGQEPKSLAVILVWVLIRIAQFALVLACIPYGIGVMWVRCSDRSLFKVNHWRIYKWLLPFTYRMRNKADWKLYIAPLTAWMVCIFAGAIPLHIANIVSGFNGT